MDAFLKQEKSAFDFIGISKDPIMNVDTIDTSQNKYKVVKVVDSHFHYHVEDMVTGES